MMATIFTSVFVSGLVSILALKWYEKFMNEWLKCFFDREELRMKEILDKLKERADEDM